MIIIYSPHYFPEYIGGAERLAELTADGFKKINCKVAIITLGESNYDTHYKNIVVYKISYQGNLSDWSSIKVDAERVRKLFAELKPSFLHIIGLAGALTLIKIAKRHNVIVGTAGMDYTIPCDKRTLIKADGSFCTGKKQIASCFNCKIESTRQRDQIFAKLGRYMPGFLSARLVSIMSAIAKRSFGAQLMWWHRLRFREILRRKIVSNLDVFIAPTNFTLDAVSHYLYLKTRLCRLMYPLSASIINASNAFKTTGHNKLIVGYIGRCIPIKGLDVLLGAAELVKRSNIYFKLFIAQNNKSTSYHSKIRKGFQKLPNTTWIDSGILNHDGLKKIHQGLDILVVPSVWQEYLGFVTLESITLGTPVILSDVASQSELIGPNNENGWLVQPGNSKKLASLLISIARKKTNKQLISPRLDTPDTCQYAKELIKIYRNQIIKKKTPAAINDN